MDEMPPARLRAFLAVADAGSLTHGARVLHLSQPALSRGIIEMERVLGCRLFDRFSGGVQLTAEGREFRSLAIEILAAHSDAATRFANFLQGSRGNLTVAALPSLAASFLADEVATFLGRNPLVSVKIRDGLGAWVVDQVLAGHADIGLTNFRGPAEHIRSQRLVEDTFFAIYSERFASHGTEVLTWADLSRAPFVALTQESSVRPLTDAAFREAGVPVRNVFEASQVVTVAGFVAAGLGVSALPSLTLPLVQFAGISVSPLREPVAHREIFLIQSRRRRLPPAARTLRGRLVRAARHATSAAGSESWGSDPASVSSN